MNRTTAFLGLAASLLLVAVVLGLPRAAVQPPPVPPPVVVVTPPAPPPPVKPVEQPGSLTLTGRLSHPTVPVGQSDVFATLDVSAVTVPGSKRSPVNLAVVIDRSGSMMGQKIDAARAAALRLVDLLDDEDRLAIVHYGTDVTVFSSQLATDDNKAKMRRFIRSIDAEGGTNIGDGLMAGRAQIDRAKAGYHVNRVLLLSDGQPTVGITTSQGLVQVASTLRQGGVSITSLGVGADFNEDLMQRLAEVGGGSYGFISSPAVMASMFERDLSQAATMVARSVTLSFTVPEGVTFREVFGRPASQSGRTVTVTLPDFSSAQTEKVVVRFTATAGVEGSAVDIAGFSLGYHDLLAQRDASQALALSALATRDLAAVKAKRDRIAFVDATRAQAAENYRRAAEKMEQGDFSGASGSIQQNAALFDEAEVVGGKDAVAEDRKTNDALFGLSTKAPSAAPEVQQLERKSLKLQYFKGSGRGSSVY